MHSFRSLTVLAAWLARVACASEPSAPPPVAHANGNSGLAVTGRDGRQFNRVLRFGDYSTSPVNPTMVHTKRTSACTSDCERTELRANQRSVYQREFDETFSSSGSKLSFTQSGPNGLGAQVRALGQDARSIDVIP
jgi:hypothetical protein